jgi:phosphohistidine phosphatase
MPPEHTLYLIRHGIAEERGDAWPDDRKRPLSADGVKKLRRSGRGLARFVTRLDIILTSPLVRARQTAEIVASGFETRPVIVNLDALAPGGSAASILSALQTHTRRVSIALVGHQPDMGHLAARLIGARRGIDFKKGAVCRIDVQTLPPVRPGALRWFVTPGILRSINHQ